MLKTKMAITWATKMQQVAVKGAIVAGAACVATVLLQGAFEPISVMGKKFPKIAVVGVTAAGSSMIADVVIPYAVPWVSSGNSTLAAWENTFLSPALTGLALVLIDATIAPGIAKEGGGLMGAFVAGTGAAVLAAYTVENLGLSPTVRAYSSA